MQMIKKTSDGVGFVRKEDYEYEGTQYKADIQQGDTITILNEGILEEGKYGERFNFQVETRNGKKKISLNQKSINILIDELGESSEDWVGKELYILMKKDVIAGKKVKVVYVVPEGWLLDDYGDLVEGGDKVQETAKEELDSESIPF